MAEGRAEGRGFAGDVGVGIHQRVAEDRGVAGGQLATDLAARRCRGQPVELVEEPRDLVGPLGVELDRMVRPRPEEEQPHLLRRDDVDDGVGRGPGPLRRGHLLPADVQELVRDVEWWLALEHLAGDRVAPVARPAGGREVLAAGFDRHAEQRPLRRPFEVPRQLRPAAERAHPAVPATAGRPLDEVEPAVDVDRLAVPVRRECRADLAAVRADDRDRQPRVGVLDVRDAPVDLADQRGPIEGRPDEAVHLPRRVDVAHPVVTVGSDPEAVEEVDEDLGVVPGVRRVAVVDLVRDVGQRRPHVALDGIGRQQRLGVHRIHVVDAVQVGRLDAAGAEGPGDDVQDDRAA